ncbi:arabinofuranosyltransferase [Actinomadura barringtoniae]|uniref:Arabinofuranosyltransferase n=1 Tax=Actinomadura barringtoniae TaxID=1427535 RepID=A0A939T146_9ACTN|nr:arabinofuranosyltransferase [Actinomadura barringtoniae]MBO2446751.1 arabinofuranosyltransferase [Actinomadura barringtoniae]
MTTTHAPAPVREDHAPGPTLRAQGLAALLTWLVAGTAAAAIPALLDLDPFGTWSRLVPAAIGLVAAALLCVPALRRSRLPISGVAVGLFAAFTVLVVRSALSGTPFAYEGVLGDTGRLSAMANRYSSEWRVVDGLGTGVSSEYPPLFPWLIGKASALLSIPAWRLLAPAEILTVSGSLVAAFALWLRLVKPPVAATISVVALLALGSPNALGAANKSYEVIALAVTVPWLILTFGNPPRGRLHWLPAGLLGGFLLLDYYAYVLFSVAGVLALMWSSWRADRRAYLVHVLRTTAVCIAIGAVYLAPFAWGMLQDGGKQVSDTYQPDYALKAVFPFITPSLLAFVELAGLGGLIYSIRKTWWSKPLLSLLGGCYVYAGVSWVRNEGSGHTGLYYYAGFLISAILLTAAVLTAFEYLPRLSHTKGVLALAATFTVAGGLYFVSNQPSLSPGGFLTYAHLQPDANGRLPRHAAEAARTFRPADEARDRFTFPVAPLRAAVKENFTGDPTILSPDEAVFVYEKWHGYLGWDRGATAALQRWDARFAELTRLSATPDLANATTAFGRIDVYVLHREGTSLVWRSKQGATATFRPAQFRGFQVTDLPNGYVVAIQKAP